MAATARSLRPVKIWLLLVAVLVGAMVVVGGATRLTESGLSITEWKPVTGALPPLSAAAWEDEFSKYQQTPQYQQINRGMSLGEFKTIFFWEWGHRLLGRVIGVAFAIPLLVFWWRGYLTRALAPRLVLLFVLGGLQGAIGWWMVASGLVDRVSVAPYRLAVHLTLAFFIFAALVWVPRSLSPPRGEAIPRGVKAAAWLLLGLGFVQVFLGAIVAGLDAGLSFTTWPLINGHFIPPAESLTPLQPAWRNLFETPISAQFAHRMTAYTLFAAAFFHLLQTRGTPLGKSAVVLFGLVTAQALIGIVTLVHLVPIPLALAHQLGALFVIGHAAGHVQRASSGTPQLQDGLVLTARQGEALMNSTIQAKKPIGRNPLIASDRVQGAPVRRPDGEDIGKIERLMLDKIGGKVAYVVMSFGGLLGVGERYYTLPWSKLDYDENLSAYVLDVTKAQLESAPELNSAGESALDRGAETALHAHYETDPYWQI